MSFVTTIIPVFNAQHYLGEALDSVARQTRRPDRVIVLDDCSTDDSPRIAAAFKPLACEVVRNERNLGLFQNHNRGLTYAAQTDFLHFLHGDDFIMPAFYEKLLAAQAGLHGRTLAYCDHVVVDEQGVPLRGGWARKNRPNRIVPVKSLLVQLAEMRPILLHGALLKTARQAAPCQFRLDLPQVGDCVFHAEWAKTCDTIVEVPEALVAHRSHPKSASTRNRLQLKAALSDEWIAMTRIAQLMGETGWRRFYRRQKLALHFGMLARLKVKMLRADPVYARQLRDEAIRTVGRFYWLAGQLLAVLRSIAIRTGVIESRR